MKKRLNAVLSMAGLAAVFGGLLWGAVLETGVASAGCQGQVCQVTQIDTCAQNGGAPVGCNNCRGVFQPCWDKYCYFENSACFDSPGGGACNLVPLSNSIGLHRRCTPDSIDWIECLGQQRCKSEGLFPLLGSGGRNSC